MGWAIETHNLTNLVLLPILFGYFVATNGSKRTDSQGLVFLGTDF
jgi:hypothetical protein